MNHGTGVRAAAHVTGTILALAMLLVAASAGAEGFGTATPGGAGGAVVRVTSLDDSGPGTLRDALRAGNRTIVFDVAGDIVLREPLYVGGPYVTIDGLTAPAPGVTLRGWGLIVRGTRGAHDVVVRGLRVREPAIDGIQVSYGAYNVLIERVSVEGATDGAIDITEQSRDVTVAWSILSGTRKSMLVKYGASRVTLHHNIFIGNASRNPQARIDDAGGRASETTLDMRHNLVWDFSGYGTLIWEGAWANVAHNFYGSSRNAIEVTAARAWVQGNRAADGRPIDLVGTESVPFEAPAVEGADACAAARTALEGAGVRPLDRIDQLRLASIDLRVCPEAVPMPVPAPTPAPVPVPVPVLPPVLQTPVESEVVVSAGDLGTAPAPPSGEADAGREIEVLVASGADDVHQDSNGTVRFNMTLLPLGTGGSSVAFRFSGVPVPPGARIQSATLWMFTVVDGMRPISVRYTGDAQPHSPPFAGSRHELSRRPRTRAEVVDVPAPWPAREYAASAELAAIVQEIVGQPGWAAGNSLTLIVDDVDSRSWRRVASFENRSVPGAGAPILLIRYQD